MFAITPRLLLRPGWPEDAVAVHEAINDEEIVRNLARAPWPYHLGHAETWLGSEADPLHPAFLIFQRNIGGGELIGSVGIGLTEEGDAEVGYWLRRTHWGLGFATEAARAIMGIAKSLGHKRLVAGHFTDNPGSGHVLRKLGFSTNGRVEQRHSVGRGGARAPCLLYRCDLSDSDAKDLLRDL